MRSRNRVSAVSTDSGEWDAWSSSTGRSEHHREAPRPTAAHAAADDSSLDDADLGASTVAWSVGNQTILGDMRTAVTYLFNVTRRERGTWLVGVFTVALVVLFVALLQNSIMRSPLIFWRLSERSVGEIDMQLIPEVNQMVGDDSALPVPLLNFTDIRTRLDASPGSLASFAIPRWYMLGRVRHRDIPSRVASAIFVLYDSEEEARVGMGRAWPHRPLGEAECHVSAPILRTLGLQENSGHRVTLSLEEDQLRDTLGVDISGLAPILDPASLFTGDLSTGNVTVNTTLDFETTFAQIEALFPVLEAAGVNTTAITPDLVESILGDGAFGNQSLPLQLALAGLTVQASAIAPFLSTGLTDDGGVAITFDYAVQGAINSADGMYPEALGNVVMIDVRHLERTLLGQIRALTTNPVFTALLPTLGLGISLDAINELLGDFRIDDFALTVIINYLHRETAYFQTGNTLLGHMAQFSNSVLDAIGHNISADVTMPVYTSIAASEIIRLFLDQIFYSVVFVLCLLSSLLIYSLMLSNVEGKTFEYGMLRAVGMRQHALVVLLVAQAMSFAIPGLCIGWTVAALADIPIAILIADLSDTDPKFGLHMVPILLTLSIGIVVPLISNYVPIRRALSSTLRDALDVYHNATSDMQVTVVRLEDMGLSPWQTSLALTLVGVGFVTYYLVPYAFTYNDLALLLTILNGILLGVVLGLAMVAQVIQPYAEWLCTHLFIWGSDMRLKMLVRKNLSGHRRRNRKTALMFTMSLAFLIFAAVLFALQGALIKDLIAGFFGADLVVLSFTWDTQLARDDLSGFLDQNKQSLVRSYSFATYSVDEADLFDSTRVAPIVDFPRVTQPLRAIDENWLETTFLKYYIPTEIADGFDYRRTEDGKKDVVESLYRHEGLARLSIEGSTIVVPPFLGSGYQFGASIPDIEAEIARGYRGYYDAVMSASLKPRVSLDTDTPLAITLRFKVSESATYNVIRMGKARSMQRKMPGFFFSSYRQFARFNPLLITNNAYASIIQEAYNRTSLTPEMPRPLPSEAPASSLLVRVEPNLDAWQREAVMNGMRTFIDSDLVQVLDIAELLESTDVAVSMLEIFFTIVSVITTLLCFFVLFLSFTANVRENAWEFGVLRALGLSAPQALRVYIYEAFSLTFSSVIMGTIIGLLAAVMVTLQIGLFTESPFTFVFPVLLFSVVVVMSFAVTVIGSWLPARRVISEQIAIVVKDAS